MKVSSLWDDVEEPVICIDDMISLVHQIHSVGPPVIPYIHHNIAIYLHSAFHLRQAPPHPYALPPLPQVIVILVNKLPVMFASSCEYSSAPICTCVVSNQERNSSQMAFRKV